METLAEVVKPAQKFAGGAFVNEQAKSVQPIAAPLPPGLAVIAARAASGRVSAGWRVRRPLTLDDLEMLEAELVNQGVMIPVANSDGVGVFSVSQRAAFEIASLRWRARRVSPNKQSRFVVDVPRYLLNWATELLQTKTYKQVSSQSRMRGASAEIKPLLPGFNEIISIDDERTTQAQLRYLELFAQYIIGIEENTPSASRDRGLEVVLKTLSDPIAQSYHCPVSLTAVLPMNDGGRWLGLS